MDRVRPKPDVASVSLLARGLYDQGVLPHESESLLNKNQSPLLPSRTNALNPVENAPMNQPPTLLPPRRRRRPDEGIAPPAE